MSKPSRITTVDNPFDPFDQYYDWLLYDTEYGYNSFEKVARIARTSEALTEEENNLEIERAIDEIVKYDFLNVYIKTYKKE